MPDEKVAAASDVNVAYMAVRSKEKQGDIPLYEVLKIERRDGKLKEHRMAEIRPGTRTTIRERMLVLNAGKDVLPW